MANERASGTSPWSALTPEQQMLLHYQVEQFLYHEAALLDARRFREWFELIATDIHYWMPIRRTVTSRDIDREFTRIGDMAFFDDDHSDLKMRVEKLYTGNSWSEDPPSRTRHMISNVQIADWDGSTASVHCGFQLMRSRLNDVEGSFYGRREDKLRARADGFELVQRHIFLDHTVIHATNLATLF